MYLLSHLHFSDSWNDLCNAGFSAASLGGGRIKNWKEKKVERAALNASSGTKAYVGRQIILQHRRAELYLVLCLPARLEYRVLESFCNCRWPWGALKLCIEFIPAAVYVAFCPVLGTSRIICALGRKDFQVTFTSSSLVYRAFSLCSVEYSYKMGFSDSLKSGCSQYLHIRVTDSDCMWRAVRLSLCVDVSLVDNTFVLYPVWDTERLSAEVQTHYVKPTPLQGQDKILSLSPTPTSIQARCMLRVCW